MKRASAVLFALALAATSIAQDGGQTGYTPASRTAHETVWQRAEWATNQAGLRMARTHEFVELATGLNHLDEVTGRWQASREEWEAFSDVIVALSGRHKVILAHNLNLGGVVDVLTPDGVRLVSSPASLGFYDPVDGKQVVIAEMKDCVAERGAAANEIVFRDCFDRIRGSIRYLYTKAGVHQQVVLEQKLVLPEGFSQRSRLECYTVFDAETPTPQIRTRVLRRETNPILRAQMLDPDFTNSEISFGGEMAMRAGKVSSLGDEAQGGTIRAGIQFVEIEGKPVLIEGVEFKEIEPLLARLAEPPETSVLAVNSSRQIKQAKEQALLPREHFRSREKGQEIQLASNPLKGPAVAIDCELLTSSTATLAGGTTWFVSGLVNVNGLRIEGTAVVKFTNSASAKINVTGAIDCKTDAYRPAIFTSQYDSSVGGSIGSGTLTNYPGALVINTTGNALHDLRISHATSGVVLGFSPGVIQLTNVQFVQCQYPIDSTASDLNEIIVDNGLICEAKSGIKGGRGLIVRARHVTAHQCEQFAYSSSGADGYAYLTNCLLVGVTNWGSHFTFITNSTTYYAMDVGGVFQTIGAGSHYLVNDSTNRNAGTMMNSALLLALKKKTTYPPIELTTNFAANTTLSPQAARDTDTLDRGYHYDPLDFVVSGRTVSANLTLTNGVALGVYGTSSSHGLGLSSGSLVSDGAATALNWIVRYNVVQEQSTTNWSASSAGPSVRKLAGLPGVRARFTGWSVPAGVNDHFNDSTASTNLAGFRDCQFVGGKFTIHPGSVALTNCLLQRVYMALRDDSKHMKSYLFVNTFYGGTLLYKAEVANPVMVAKNNFFDRTVITRLSGGKYFTHDFNGYIAGQDRLQPSPAQNDVEVSAMAYARGPLGDFYQAQDDLIAEGNWNAPTWGLFHHTTQANQARETNSWLDVGFHYVAFVNGQPADTDGDGLPDYLEDTIGNGAYGFGDFSSWTNADSDGDCVSDGQEYQHGSNLTDVPVFTSPPVCQILPVGATAVFSATVAQGCLSGYQWDRDYTYTIPGATNLVLTLTNVQLSSNGFGLYRLRAYSPTKTNYAAVRLVVLDRSAWTIWTNYVSQTNNKSINLWTHGNPVAWNTNCLLYGKTGYTAISLSNSFQGTQGRITALTKRHGYTAGHHFQARYYDGFGGHTKKSVWFCTSDNRLVEMTVAATYVRISANGYDYALFIFSQDLTNTITPMAVMTAPSSIGVCFRTSQSGWMSANMQPPLAPFLFDDSSKPPFNSNPTHIGGDSGSPNMIPVRDGSLVFIGGTSSSGPSVRMQEDMDYLCTNATYKLNLNITNYQLNWYTNYP